MVVASSFPINYKSSDSEISVFIPSSLKFAIKKLRMPSQGDFFYFETLHETDVTNTRNGERGTGNGSLETNLQGQPA